MSANRWASVALVCALTAGGCGGDDEGEPLLGGSLTAEYDGAAFTPVNGYATTYQDGAIIVLGDGSIRCGVEDDNAPPSGNNAVVSVPAIEIGSYTSVFVQMFSNDGGNFEGIGSNSGTVEITSVTAEAVAGTVAFDYTDDESRHFAIDGTFEVLHCE